MQTNRSPETREQFRMLGLNPDVHMGSACADFYLLERMDADGISQASHLFRRTASWLSRELLTYLTVIVGGELRHYGRVEECDCCRHAGWSHEHLHDEGGRCLREREECECYCYGGSRDDPPLPQAYMQLWRKFVFGTWYGVEDRVEVWGGWLRLCEENGPDMLKMAEIVFQDDDGWDSGYGGDTWATIAEVAYTYATGGMKDRLFIDRAWTLEHNGGCMFDKLYHPDLRVLESVLVRQAEDDYDYLASVATDTVRRLWERRKYIVLRDDGHRVTRPGQMRWRPGFGDRDPAWLGMIPDYGEAM